MTKRERRKGVEGEREVRAIYEGAGFTVRGLEGEGDHIVIANHVVLHGETKRCETARPWAWIAQAESEAPPGAVPVVAFRRSRSQWYALLPLDDLVEILRQ